MIQDAYIAQYSGLNALLYQLNSTSTNLASSLTALTNMSAKLAGEKKQIFRDTLVTNVRDMIDLLDRFNVTDNPKMKQAKTKIENALLGVTPDALREDDDFRLDTKAKVDELLKEFSW